MPMNYVLRTNLYKQPHRSQTWPAWLSKLWNARDYDSSMQGLSSTDSCTVRCFETASVLTQTEHSVAPL